MHFIPNTDDDRKEMLRSIGVSSFEELLKDIPETIRLRDGISIPKGISEYEVLRELQEFASRNVAAGETVSFMGAGAYDHFIPAAVGAIISRSEFSTAYTPYQAEVSQGTLQAIYEYQTMICNLTGMDVANASMYDAGSALAEASLLAAGHTARKQIVVSGKIHPSYLDVIRTYCEGQDIEVVQTPATAGVANLERLRAALSDRTAAVIVQNPNFYGCIENSAEIGKLAHAVEALFIVAVDPISLGLLRPPSECGADVVVGEGQVFGNPQSFGGPYLGIFAVKEPLLRRIPGRISGVTVDAEGKRGFVLTVQTREQHIRREKATSNICTNQGLNMLAATVYLSLLGKQGLQEVARLCVQKSHYLSTAIAATPRYRIAFPQPFFKEFAIETSVPAQEVVSKLSSKGILSGVALDSLGDKKNLLLVAVTEKRTKAEMDAFVSALRGVV